MSGVPTRDAVDLLFLTRSRAWPSPHAGTDVRLRALVCPR